MLINISKFNDLGKCSFGTSLPDIIDTDNIHIYFKVKEVCSISDLDKSFIEARIDKVEDFLKFAWSNPMVQSGNSVNDICAWFVDAEPWWKRSLEARIEDDTATYDKYKKRIDKTTDQIKIESLRKEMEYYNPDKTRERIERYNAQMEDNIKLILEDNK